MSNAPAQPRDLSTRGPLAAFVDAGVLDPADIAVATAIGTTGSGIDDETLLAAALAVRGLQLGHVCIDIDTVAHTTALETTAEPAVADRNVPDPGASAAPALPPTLPWPEPEKWKAILATSPVVAQCDATTASPRDSVVNGVTMPLVFDGTRLYLERYWRYERRVGDALLSNVDTDDAEPDTSPTLSGLSAEAIAEALDRYFGSMTDAASDLQRRGAELALQRRVTVLAGGPGTGKTHTISRLLAAALHLGRTQGVLPTVALAAPTGKAAARMTEQVHQAVDTTDAPDDVDAALLATDATTIHRLLGYRDGIEFAHDASNPLPHDLVIIDETSMVALPLMSRLLDALRPSARLVLVGDPYQLVSVEAGSVLSDIVGPAVRSADAALDGPLADNITVLERVHRFGSDSAIARLADAVRAGDADEAIALLAAPALDDAQWIRPDDTRGRSELTAMVNESAAAVVAAATAGDGPAALQESTRCKVLCGTRFGPNGAYAWSDHIERFLASTIDELSRTHRWYIGRPITVTRNDYITGVFNGDVGIVINGPDGPMVAMHDGSGARMLHTSQLSDVDTWWAMTIHKSQGSEFDHAVVSLPDDTSRVLSNELLYTGITRARSRVTILASETSLRDAIGRPISRASGLQQRLWPPHHAG